MATKRSLAVALFSFCLSVYGFAGTSSIGSISARGDVRIDGHSVRGNATLFDGTFVETSTVSATLRLENGTEILLQNNSRGVVRRDRFVLMQGKCQLKNSTAAYFIDADGQRVVPVGPNTVSATSFDRAGTLEVAAFNGEVRVLGESGISLADLAQGNAVSLSNSKSHLNTPGALLSKAPPKAPVNPGTPPPSQPNPVLGPPASN